MTVPIAVQLYSLRDALEHNLEPVFARLAEIGYVGVEPYGGLDAAQVAALSRRYGLQIPSAHLAPPLDADERPTLDAADVLGIERIVVPYLPPEHFADLDTIKRTADRLNAASDIARRHGRSLGYHNHWWELNLIDGKTVLDHLRDQVAPEIFFEIDTYWVKTGGQDPAQVVGSFGVRAPLLHIKDGPADNSNSPMVAVGTGTLDFPAVVGASAANWLIVELDKCASDMMTAIEASYQYLTTQGLAHGR